MAVQVELPKKVDRKAKLSKPHYPPPVRPVEERVKDFEETYQPYDPDTAVLEAERCLYCPNAPCMQACPVHNNIPAALYLIGQRDFLGAAEVFRTTSNMPEVCGRVCPQEILCEGHCVFNRAKKPPLAIGKLEAFVADYQRQALGGFPKPEKVEPTGRTVAVVGSGPAGLAAAEELAKRGHSVTVYEAWPKPGGLLRYGIPGFKLSKTIVDEKIAFLEELGVRFVCNTRVGKDVSLLELKERHDAVFIGVGAGVGAQLKVPGVDLKGIYQATPFLVKANLDPEELPEDLRQEPLDLRGKRVAVIGGGDTAMDCLRTSVRLGAAEVVCYYRRTEAEMPGNSRDRKLAKEEGARFEFLTAPVRFIGDEEGRVKEMELVRMELGEPDESGRRRPVPIEGSNFTVPVDVVVLAVGYWPDPTLGETTPGLQTHKWGLIVVDEETGQTSLPGVYAGGDAVRGPDLVVTAMASARKAAAAIDAYLRSLGNGHGG